MLYLIAGAVAAYAAYQLFFGDSPDDHRSQPQVRRCDDRHWQSPRRDDYLPQAPSQARTSSEGTPQDLDSAKSKRDQITPEEIYASLRSRAKREGDLMAQCYQQSKEAYERRDRARAKVLSDEGKRHALKMEKLNADACTTIFKENNRDRVPCEVDLHGLYVKEAIVYAQKTVIDARRRGDSEIKLIVGQGNHSEGGVSRLKPAIQEDLQTRGHRVEVDPKNPGVLLVRVGGR